MYKRSPRMSGAEDGHASPNAALGAPMRNRARSVLNAPRPRQGLQRQFRSALAGTGRRVQPCQTVVPTGVVHRRLQRKIYQNSTRPKFHTADCSVAKNCFLEDVLSVNKSPENIRKQRNSQPVPSIFSTEVLPQHLKNKQPRMTSVGCRNFWQTSQTSAN